jgi:hypothetical protein
MSHEINDTPKQTAEAPHGAANALLRDSQPSPPSAGREVSASNANAGQPNETKPTGGDKQAGDDRPSQGDVQKQALDKWHTELGNSAVGAEKNANPTSEKPDAKADQNLGLPKVELFDSQAPKNSLDSAKQALGDNNASAEDKLKSAHTLADAGINKVQVADKDGKMHDYRIETEKAGQNTMVHMYEKGASGKENVALRGVERADGSVGHEKDSRGRDVAFEGSHAGKSQPQEHVRTHSRHQPEVKAPETKAPESKAPETKAPESKTPEAKKPEASDPAAKPTRPDVISQHEATATGYYPHNDSLQGGFKDMKEQPLHTLQQYLNGKAPYVSVAMDNKAGIKYGQKLNIPELNKEYGKEIPFRVVDTGSAFKHKGTSRIDICTESNSAAHADSVNRKLTLQFVR